MFKMFFNVVQGNLKKAAKAIKKESVEEVKKIIQIKEVKPKVKVVKKVKKPLVKVKSIKEEINPASKKVYAFVGKKNVGVYDSITLCASTLGLSRPAVKKAIESGVILDNGFVLKLTNK